MKKKSLEEKQLSINMLRSEDISIEIYKELEVIHGELERKGKWNDFILNLDKVQFREESKLFKKVDPVNYYESLYVAFNLLDKYEELNSKVEFTMTEARLLEGKGMEEFEIPEEDKNYLENLGIIIEPGFSEAPSIRNGRYEVKICTYYLNSRKLLKSLGKALKTLRDSKIHIFSNY